MLFIVLAVLVEISRFKGIFTEELRHFLLQTDQCCTVFADTHECCETNARSKQHVKEKHKFKWWIIKLPFQSSLLSTTTQEQQQWNTCYYFLTSSPMEQFHLRLKQPVILFVVYRNNLVQEFKSVFPPKYLPHLFVLSYSINNISVELTTSSYLNFLVARGPSLLVFAQHREPLSVVVKNTELNLQR